MNRALVTSLLCSLLGMGCSAGDAPGGSIPGCEGKCDGIGEFAPIAGPESLVHCELNSNRDVVCDYVGVPDSFPVGVTVEAIAVGMNFRDSNGQLQSGQTASIEFQEPGAVTLLGALPQDQLPVRVLINLDLDTPFLVGDQFSDRTNLRSYNEVFTFEEPGDETPDLPLPLEFWPVRLFAAADGNVRSASVGPQEIDVSPWTFFIGEPVVQHLFNLPSLTGEPMEFLLPVAPEQTELRANGTYCNDNFRCTDDVEFVFAGPGIYSLGSDGAMTFVPAPGSDAGPQPDVGTRADGGPGTDVGPFDGGPGVDAGGSDAGPPPCGTNGQRVCPDGMCAENHQLDGDFCFSCGIDGEERCAGESQCADGHFLESNRCVPCGNDGEVACLNTSTRRRFCNEGHFHDTNAQTCAVCGDDDQVACYNSSTRRRFCNEGQFHDTSTQTCAACGDDGQTACYNSSTRRRFCNEGQFHDTSTQTCADCGDDGQTACYNSSTRRRFCNEGHFHDTSANSCTICGDDGQVACFNSSTRRRFCNDGFRVGSGNICVPE